MHVVAEYHILQTAWRNILVSVGKVQTLVSSLLSFKKNVITENKKEQERCSGTQFPSAAN
jgi:hypothetical protein